MRQKNLDAQSARFEEILRNHIAEMKKTHAYVVRSTLTAARLDLNSRTPPPGIIYDETSPFEDMKSIEIAVTEAKDKRLDVGRFSVRVHGKAHSSSEIKLVVPATISETPKTLAQMPKYHSYTTLRNNILADDDEIMRYFPYFGEDVEEDELHLEDTFLDKTKSSAEEGKNSECKIRDRRPLPLRIRPFVDSTRCGAVHNFHKFVLERFGPVTTFCNTLPSNTPPAQ